MRSGGTRRSLPVPDLLLAHATGLLLRDDTLHLLVEDTLLLDLEEEEEDRGGGR